MSTAFCTVVTKSHLAYARVLAQSLREHDPSSKVFVLLADLNDGLVTAEQEPFELISLNELNDQAVIQKMCFYYTPPELCFCLRAWLHEYMLQRTSYEKWIYLDSDIVVCHSLREISDKLDQVSILLSPHLISVDHPQSVDMRALIGLESYLLGNGGIYNGGFLGLRRTEESVSFIRWFKARLGMYGFDDRPRQSGDQFWLTNVPLYFENVSVLRAPGANLAYWNLFERKIELDAAGKIKVNGEPLLFFHFAGFNPAAPRQLTKYAYPAELWAVPDAITELAVRYRDLLNASSHAAASSYPYAFGKFISGEAISPAMRRLYFKEIYQGTYSAGSPFEQYQYFAAKLRWQNLKASVKKVVRNGKNFPKKVFRY